MSDETTGGSYPTIQHSWFTAGDQTVLRAADGESLADAAESLAKNADRFTEAVTSIKQAMLAKAVFTGTVEDGTAAPKARTESGPPSDEDSVPHCKHGPMDDLIGKGYKSRYYCTLKTKDWKEKCKPVG